MDKKYEQSHAKVQVKQHKIEVQKTKVIYENHKHRKKISAM